MVSVKKVPERMCLGCQKMHNKKDMIRIVRSPEGEFSVDVTGKKSGRGAYLCHNIDCFNAAIKEHRFEKSFKSIIDNRVYDELKMGIFQIDG
jgi:uncharacterized protein